MKFYFFLITFTLVAICSMPIVFLILVYRFGVDGADWMEENLKEINETT